MCRIGRVKIRLGCRPLALVAGRMARAFVPVVALSLATSQPAAAYIGPGVGITAIGTVIALVGAILLALIGFLWYPIKRLRTRMRRTGAEESAAIDPPPPSR